MRPSLRLHASKVATVRRGHPWIFPKAIATCSGTLRTGELVDVLDAEGTFLAVGVYNEFSLYRVRILALAFEVPTSCSFASIIHMRLQQALMLRQAINLPNAETNAYRLCNSEADGLSGLTIDCFDNTLVISSSAYWVQARQETIRECLQALLPNKTVIWLPQAKLLAQDGWDQQLDAVPETAKAEVLEAGIRYQVQFANAQKTGLFLDQRDNHQRIAALAKGKRVLDLYTYTGGFALHAAAAQASLVTAVDSSAKAIAEARHNAALNGLEHITFIEADARDYLSRAGEYDLVILDPPKLVPSQRHLERAKNYYRFLHREVFKAMRPGSLLLSCNCSSALSSADFSALITTQAMMSHKQARVLGVFGPASCHPTLSAFPEGQYLTAVLLAVV